MELYLHIGLEHVGVSRIQSLLDEKRERLQTKGVLIPSNLGGKNHTRLFMAVLNPDHIDPLRQLRGAVTPESQQTLRNSVIKHIEHEISRHSPKKLILTASQFGTVLCYREEIARLAEICRRFSDKITVVAHVDAQARILTRHYEYQLKEGRELSLAQEMSIANAGRWWDAAMAARALDAPFPALSPEIQAPPFWLDYTKLVDVWEAEFGKGSMRLRPYSPDVVWSANVAEEARASFDLPNFGKPKAAPRPAAMSSASLTRMRMLNGVVNKLLRSGEHIDRSLRQSLISGVLIDGPPMDHSDIGSISATFKDQNNALSKIYPELATALAAEVDEPSVTWTEADPKFGFRPTQYLAAQLHRITAATHQRDARIEEKRTLKLSQSGEKLLPPLARQNYLNLRQSQFAPHNNLPPRNEEDMAAPYFQVPMRPLRNNVSGNVIVGCMKNEAPYILEWIAYHRAIGVDKFLIYTNGCEDGTDEILGRLQELGVIEHRLNNDWKGKSPQQHALNRALEEPVVRQADWVIHIDVDEFINVRCGNGTLADFFARVPDATNVAMTWRLFGHNGVATLEDDLVISQFETCAPKYCPKPHTSWGFKTMMKNIGAYEKLSCHRPNRLVEKNAKRVKWVNGSGEEITQGFKEAGWRSTQKSVGYDLLQLNHYALRSAEGFLVKRQRGRALHVDRTVGLNYWIRMDWSDHRDITIQRNIPRVQAEMQELLRDDALAQFHKNGLAWHRAKIEELHGVPEFEEIYQFALTTNLPELERVAFSLALDMES